MMCTFFSPTCEPLFYSNKKTNILYTILNLDGALKMSFLNFLNKFEKNKNIYVITVFYYFQFCNPV